LQTNVVTNGTLFANLLHIFRGEGVNGLYRGLMPTLGAVVPSISIYFTLYNSIKHQLGCPTGDQVKDVALQSASAGLASSATAALTNPLWLVKTRLQVQPIYKLAAHTNPPFGTRDAFRTILKEEGVRGLYKGLGASLLTSCQAMVQFPIYEKLKSLMCSSEHTFKKSTATYLAASAISASLACILTYPSEVVRARLQAQHGFTNYNGITHAFKKIWMTEGFTSLYRGLWTSLVKMTPAHAISFTVYEFILKCATSYTEVPEGNPYTASKNDLPQFAFRPYGSLFDSNTIPFRFTQGQFSSINFPRTSSMVPAFSGLFNNGSNGASSSNGDVERSDFACTMPSPPEPTVQWNEYFW
jgi:solute carrier family 25 folate transporter 32